MKTPTPEEQKQREKDFYEGSECVLCAKQIEAETRKELLSEIAEDFVEPVINLQMMPEHRENAWHNWQLIKKRNGVIL